MNNENIILPQSNLTHLPRNQFVPGIGLGIAKCPYDPLDNSTAIYVEKGNPGDLPGLVSIHSVTVLCGTEILMKHNANIRRESIKGHQTSNYIISLSPCLVFRHEC